VVGAAEMVLSKLFRTSTNRVPTLLILDDIHLICPKRGSGGSSQGIDRLAATLLALMDGIEGRNNSSNNHSNRRSNVFILAITTNPSLLDPALRRPGRLDAEVEVPLPEDARSRAEILHFHVNHFGMDCADELQELRDFVDVAKAAKGFNGADCMLAVKEAIRIAMLEDRTDSNYKLDKHHLYAAMKTIKPSAIKSITVEIPQVLWSSIGGMDSVKRDLREAIELPLSHLEYFEQLRVPPPRGILLYGPPGCSKTLMARALATEGNMNFLAVKGPELLSKWLGESERALSSLFRRARMASPAIVFFDEIDAIASKRGSGDSASSGRLLSQLLTELDGVNHTSHVGGDSRHTRTKHHHHHHHHRVVVVGATNRPDLLDTALTRPGRMDRMIYVGPPDAASRAQILQITLEKSKCSPDIDIPTLAEDNVTGGFSGAEMVALCRDAALLALEEVDDVVGSTDVSNAPMIEMRHLYKAIESMPRQITPSMIEFYKSYQENVTVI
jgi:SpoVK/Ycf46/Vps4 family AAA+-type ATPase